jgi:hypothetical protein
MNQDIRVLKERAEAARLLYKRNEITREEAHAQIKPYIMAVNHKSKELSKKYGRPAKYVFISSFLR